MKVVFDAELWIWDARRADSWTFVILPVEESAALQDMTGGSRRGFGSLRVRVTIGGSGWKTSVFPGKGRGCYALPIKRTVREAEGLGAVLLGVRPGGALACRRQIFRPAQDGQPAALLGGRRATAIVQQFNRPPVAADQQPTPAWMRGGEGDQCPAVEVPSVAARPATPDVVPIITKFWALEGPHQRPSPSRYVGGMFAGRRAHDQLSCRVTCRQSDGRLNSEKGTAVKRTRIIASGLVGTAAALTLISAPAVANAEPSKAKKLAVAVQLTLPTEDSFWAWAKFRANRNKDSVKQYNFSWNNDGCTVKDAGKIPGVKSWAKIFAIPCVRHDFGYRNLKDLVSTKRWTDVYRKGVDRALLQDMLRTCSGMKAHLKPSCNSAAAQFYAAVRWKGK
ncbi:phospholipase A2 [Nonomuraea sp. NPDC049269]|uniref:phospholipase A2 n=1 Tax=Nonomuraea sp. NPDC049269 TaxID=3364349 RepID=UPI00371F320B